MNGRPVTEAQISQALRAHLPKRAQAGLHERILVAVDDTAQQRALPSLLGVLQDADPGARRRNLLIAAALLIALAIAAAAAAGAWLPRRDVAPDLSLLPPADLQPLPSPSLSAPSAAPTPSAVTSPTGIWIATGSMGTPRSDHTAVRLLDGRVLVVGGAEAMRTTPPRSCTTRTAAPGPPPGTCSSPTKASRPRCCATAGCSWGMSTTRIPRRMMTRSRAQRCTTRPAGPGPPRGRWSTVVVAKHGHIAARRQGARDRQCERPELYDPDSGTWTATGKMTDPRHSHAAILLPDGNVLVAGGHAPGDEPTDSAELYDPDTGTWTAIANMRAPREAIEAFLLPDGKVLVVGGSARRRPAVRRVVRPGHRDMDRRRGHVQAGHFRRCVHHALVGWQGADDQRGTTDSSLCRAVRPRTGSWTTTAPMLRSHGTPGDPAARWHGPRGRWQRLFGRCVCATGSAELYVPQACRRPRCRPSRARPHPSSRPRPRVRPVPARGRSRPAGRTILEGHRRQQEFRSRRAVPGRGGRERRSPAVRGRYPQRRKRRRHPEGDRPASPEACDGLLGVGEPGSGRGGNIVPDVRRTPGRHDPHRCGRAGDVRAEPVGDSAPISNDSRSPQTHAR